MLPLLHRTSSLFHSSARKLASHAPVAARPAGPLSLKELVLPPPHTLTPQLLALGIDLRSSLRISSTLERLCEQLKNRLEVDYKRRSHSLQARAEYYQDSKSISMLPLTYLILYEKAVKNWSSYILENFAPRLIRAISNARTGQPISSQCDPRKQRRSFNQSAVPILENFFEHNAFPSRLEKLELAAKCHMEYRQIHVWFQNRRNRYRKDGKDLKRRDSGGLANELENAVIEEIFPCEGLSGGISEHASVPPHDNQPSAGFKLDAPPHAFPSPYPPICSYEPFPSAGKRDLQIPSLRVREQSTSTTWDDDVDGMVAAFQRLSIGNVRSPPLANAPEEVRRRAPSWSPFQTYCPPAPLPSLVRRQRRATCGGTLSCGSTSRADRAAPQATRRIPWHHSPPHRTDVLRRELGFPTPAIPQQPSPHTGSPSCRPKRSLTWRAPRNTTRRDALAALGEIESPTSARSTTMSRTPSIQSLSSDDATSSDRDTPLHTPPSWSKVLPSAFSSPILIGHEEPLDFASSLSSRSSPVQHLAIEPKAKALTPCIPFVRAF